MVFLIFRYFLFGLYKYSILLLMAFLQYTSPTIMENVLFPASAQLQHNSVHLQSSTPITYYSLHESNVLPVRLVLMLLFIIDDVNFPVNSLSLSLSPHIHILIFGRLTVDSCHSCTKSSTMNVHNVLVDVALCWGKGGLTLRFCGMTLHVLFAEALSFGPPLCNTDILTS